MAETLTPEELAHRIQVYNTGAYEYPKHTWYLITGFMSVVISLNVFSVYWTYSRRRALLRPQPKDESSSKTQTGASRGTTTGNISLRRVPSAVATALRVFSYRWRIPKVPATLIEISITTLYLGILLMYTFTNTLNLDVAIVQSRAADLVTAQFPLIVFLATKNNVLQFLTGISHEKLNIMHRATSRVALLLTWIHLWGLYIEQNLDDLTMELWRWMGMFAGVAQTLLTCLSIQPIRKRWYEFFFISHVVLVLLFLVTTYIHVAGIGTPFPTYVWPCFLIWGLDRLCRYARYLILTNFHAPNDNPATLELVSDDTIRITARRRFPIPHLLDGWAAGQHMFLAFPTIGPIESHPFTIASIAAPEIEQQSISSEGKGSQTSTKCDNEFELVWIARVRSGFTRRLKSHIVLKNRRQVDSGVHTGLTCTLPIFLDGPYGAPRDIRAFETCVFISGGSGVTYTLPRMHHILNEVSAHAACVKRVIFVWAIRDESHINWIAPELAKAIRCAPPQIELSVAVHITQLTESPSASQPDTPPTLVSQGSADSQSAHSVEKDIGDFKQPVRTGPRRLDLDMKGVDIYQGRPDLREVLEDAVTTSSGPVSVDAAGPEPMVAAIRLALSAPFAGPVGVLRGTAPTVELNIESFTM